MIRSDLYIVKNASENISKIYEKQNIYLQVYLQIWHGCLHKETISENRSYGVPVVYISIRMNSGGGIPWLSHYAAATDLNTQWQLFIIKSVWSRYLQWFLCPARYDQWKLCFRVVLPSVHHTLRVPLCVQHPTKTMPFQQLSCMHCSAHMM